MRKIIGILAVCIVIAFTSITYADPILPGEEEMTCSLPYEELHNV